MLSVASMYVLSTEPESAQYGMAMFSGGVVLFLIGITEPLQFSTVSI